jgi:hypothetical protein
LGVLCVTCASVAEITAERRQNVDLGDLLIEMRSFVFRVRDDYRDRRQYEMARTSQALLDRIIDALKRFS